MESQIIISTAISFAAVIISASQIIVAHINKTKEIKLAKEDQDKKWKMSMAEFVLNHYDEIISENVVKKGKMKDIIKLAFPQELSKILFEQFESLVLSELLGPIVINLNRSKEAFRRWNEKNIYLESKIIKDSNQLIRDLLVNKAYLIPEYLIDDANKLVTHYDAWLEEFAKVRGDKNLDNETEFVFVGPKGYPFPVESERAIIEAYYKIKEEYNIDSKSN